MKKQKETNELVVILVICAWFILIGTMIYFS